MPKSAPSARSRAKSPARKPARRRAAKPTKALSAAAPRPAAGTMYWKVPKVWGYIILLSVAIFAALCMKWHWLNDPTTMYTYSANWRPRNQAAEARGGMMGGKKSVSQAFSFFVTSANPGQGADLGGLAGADAYCQSLAEKVGAGTKAWHAYLSTTATGSRPAVNARDRIGKGPWYNVAGARIAYDLAELHANPTISKDTALTEAGEIVFGRGDAVNMHDVLTGSMPDGTASTAKGDTTCKNWTSSAATGSALVGHHDRMGLDTSDAARSWNSSHASRGCSLENLKGTGGNGRLYCFAVAEE